MNIIQRRGFGLACLVLAGLSSSVQADHTTGKITDYITSAGLNPAVNGDTYTVAVNGYYLTSSKGIAELLREAFLRKLTVTVHYTRTYSPFPQYSPPTGNVTSVTIQSIDLP